jgi:hypothetical protein
MSSPGPKPAFILALGEPVGQRLTRAVGELRQPVQSHCLSIEKTLSHVRCS